MKAVLKRRGAVKESTAAKDKGVDIFIVVLLIYRRSSYDMRHRAVSRCVKMASKAQHNELSVPSVSLRLKCLSLDTTASSKLFSRSLQTHTPPTSI